MTMGFDEPWLHQTPDEIIAEMMDVMAVKSPAFAGLTLERLQQEAAIPIHLDTTIPFADLHFSTPSGKVELYSQQLADEGLDALPGWRNKMDDGAALGAISEALHLVSGAAHHFVSTSFGNVAGLLAREGKPFVEIHPDDATIRSIKDGDLVEVANGRGSCRLQAVVTDAIRPGVVASPKGRWSNLDPHVGNGAAHQAGRNINWTTPDALADMGGQSTFHSNLVWVSKVTFTRTKGRTA